jgi:thioredoxin 1
VSENILSVVDESFETEVLKSDLPILVDFWAEWCGPCRAIAPIIEEIAATYQDKLKVVKLNVDDNPKTTANFGVRGIPTLILFKQGKSVDSHVGMISKTQLAAFLDKHL